MRGRAAFRQMQRLSCVALALLMLGGAGFAQDAANAPATSAGGAAQAAAGERDAAVLDALSDDPIASDPKTAPVEVSLGDWTVKTAIAAKLSRKVSQIPLTVKVPPKIASEVCPQDSGDLEQQVIVSPTRTCAAKKATPALEDEVRKAIAKKESLE
ncbi:hypothetical protein LQ948_00940 [Jiella sp. MQZ9-1]|uniref:UrcA family protein n=1 Tax=Jiella flava TaxID=2816857 RepID=A0A939FX56_9HYPH|nr:hypothetical protein [Jiella flava]MBO0661127.1 hypothetical protein [Jiella flava]MCD2469773.1 hypothetical protein [Jiella flava]